ncbi:MAG: helix-turn-helix domain-containing protein [Micromonosporaceae bacterium]
MSPAETIGERLAELRTRRAFTQEELAELSGVSVATIRKLEQNERTSARMSTLHRLASALRTTTSELLAAAPKLAGPPSEPDEMTVLALRRALTPPRGLDGAFLADAETERPTLDSLRESLRVGRAFYRDSKFSAGVESVSSLMAELRLATAVVDGDDRVALHDLHAKVYQLAANFLIQLRLFDLAYLALDRSMDSADKAGDRLLTASSVSTLTFLLLRQGRLNEAARVATVTADQIEPKLSTASQRHVSLWGWLLLGGSAAAVRDNQHAEADDILSLARAAAARVDGYADGLGAPFGPERVIIQAVENKVIEGEPEKALAISARIPPTGDETMSHRCRHLLDVASAQTDLRQYAEATETLTSVYRTVPEWIRYQRYARETVSRLIKKRKRTISPELRELADFLRVV